MTTPVNTIVGIDCFLVHLPIRRTHRWAGLTEDIGRYVLVRIRTDSGIDGWGEATVLPQWGGAHGRHYGEDPHTVFHLVRNYWAQVLLGADSEQWRTIAMRMHKPVSGYPFSRSAIESALLDVRARGAGIPVHDLIGGRLRTEIPVAHSIGLLPDGDVVSEAVAAIGEGARAIKVKVGEDTSRDLAVIESVRKQIGTDVALAADANEGWGSAPEAIAVLKRLEPFELRYVEQPIQGLAILAQLARATTTPIMADEAAWVPYDMLEISHATTPMLASIYVGKSGGISTALRADAIAATAGIGTNVNGSGETGVGNLVNLHLAASMASLAEASVLPVTGLFEARATQVVGAMYQDDVLAEPMQYHDGHLVVPTGPGLGIEVDADKVDAYCVDRLTLQLGDSTCIEETQRNRTGVHCSSQDADDRSDDRRDETAGEI